MRLKDIKISQLSEDIQNQYRDYDIKIKKLTEENNILSNNIILHNLKKIIISINKRNKILDSIQYKNYFIKWTLISRILSMKAVTDEKKRKKRQKQFI